MITHIVRSLTILVLLCIAGFPQITQTSISIDGLKTDVTVKRDGRGIPYIDAKSDADLYFAQGYVTASDRLWQMDLMRRLARGQLAEIFGEVRLEEDKRWRRFGFAGIVEKSLALATPESRALLDSYARGVNAYIASLDEKSIPPEFTILQYEPAPWLATDTLIIGAILADALSSTWRLDLIKSSLSGIDAQKFADLNDPVTPYDVVLFGKDKSGNQRGSKGAYLTRSKAGNTVSSGRVSALTLRSAELDEQVRTDSLSLVGLYAEELAASNNWVISGKRTADGKAMLASDPHLSPTTPGIWHLVDLRTPTMHVAGVTVPGMPGVVIGHNESIAWGMTNVGPDVQDLYAEIFNAAGEYKTPAGWSKPIIRRETIDVRVNPLKTDTREQTLEVVETRNGVVITEEAGKKYALKWTARDPQNMNVDGFFLINRATDWPTFKTALKAYTGPTQNFVYADIKGNIGWYVAGRIPIRKNGDGTLPYDGATDDGAWLGNIPFEELPNLYNPRDGFIVTANQRIVGTDYKYQQMTRVFGSARARRIYDLLSKNKKATMDDSRDIQHDVYNWPLANFAKTLVAEGAISPETLSVLKDWDGKMIPDSRAAVLVNEISTCVINRMADDNKPVPAFLIRGRVFDLAVREKLPRWLPAAFKNYGDLYKACDSAIRSDLASSKTYGSDPSGWTWGKSFTSRFAHPLAAVPLIGGQFTTPNVGIAGSSDTPNVGSSVSMRFITSPGHWDATRFVIPMGQSGNPRSPHFKDQFDLWRTGSPAIFPFSTAAVEKSAKEMFVMTPK